MKILETRNLFKKYKEFVAVNGIDLSIEKDVYKRQVMNKVLQMIIVIKLYMWQQQNP